MSHNKELPWSLWVSLFQVHVWGERNSSEALLRTASAPGNPTPTQSLPPHNYRTSDAGKTSCHFIILSLQNEEPRGPTIIHDDDTKMSYWIIRTGSGGVQTRSPVSDF